MHQRPVCVGHNALWWPPRLPWPLGWGELHQGTSLHHQTPLHPEQGVFGPGVDLWWRSGLQRWHWWEGYWGKHYKFKINLFVLRAKFSRWIQFVKWQTEFFRITSRFNFVGGFFIPLSSVRGQSQNRMLLRICPILQHSTVQYAVQVYFCTLLFLQYVTHFDA